MASISVSNTDQLVIDASYESVIALIDFTASVNSWWCKQQNLAIVFALMEWQCARIESISAEWLKRDQSI